MTGGRSYGSPGAFRRALTDKLRDLATRSRWTLQQLQRQMTYDRLLERLYLVDEGWIVKGATALLAREIGVRGTIDIDLYREVAREIAVADLREAAALDLGDWLRFEIGPPRPLADTGGVRLPVKALVGNTERAAFHVDLVGEDLRMTGDPEDVPPLARVVMPMWTNEASAWTGYLPGSRSGGNTCTANLGSAHASRGRDRVLQQRGLAHPGLAVHHQRAAAPGQQLAERRSLGETI